MSVHTVISPLQLQDILRDYAVGELLRYTPIAAGITNSNYHVTTTGGEYVLTLFEQDSADVLLFFLQLMSFLAAKGLPCPHTLQDKQQRYLGALGDKPLAFIEFLPGNCVAQANVAQCYALGRTLAQLHQYATALPLPVPANTRGATWRDAAAARLMPVLSAPQQQLLQQELTFQRQQQGLQLPQGLIHADLFRDNVLFVADEITGLIDFYYACHDYWVLDLAIVINDWCVTADGNIDTLRYQQLLRGYQSERELTPGELAALPVMQRSAALRFWLSRLLDWHFTADNPLLRKHDPAYFQRLLCVAST